MWLVQQQYLNTAGPTTLLVASVYSCTEMNSAPMPTDLALQASNRASAVFALPIPTGMFWSHLRAFTRAFPSCILEFHSKSQLWNTSDCSVPTYLHGLAALNLISLLNSMSTDHSCNPWNQKPKTLIITSNMASVAAYTTVTERRRGPRNNPQDQKSDIRHESRADNGQLPANAVVVHVLRHIYHR